MSVLGTIIKESTKYSGYKIRKKKSNSNQEEILRNLLSKASNTEYGIRNNFQNLLKEWNVKIEFRDKVPLQTYESLYSWIEKSLNGEKNILWPGEIKFFALSSGTTKGSSKKIPVSDQMIKQFQKTSLEQLLTLHKLNLSTAFYESSVLTLGGCTKLKKYDNHFEGDLSGILQKNKSFVYKPFSKPSQKISQIENWEEKMKQIILKAPSWNIGVVAGVPTWVIKLFEGIKDHYQIKSIHEIWPNFRLYLHGGVFLGNYQDKIDSFCEKPIYYQNTYLASEGYFAYQHQPRNQGLNLLLKNGIYFEFIPKQFFDKVEEGNLHAVKTLTIDEIEPNQKYALVISTISGLWRYIIGDVVKFTCVESFEIEIIGRISHYLNMAGEHVSAANMNKALVNTAKMFDIQIDEFCVVVSEKKDRHLWYVGTSKILNEHHMAIILDNELRSLNDDYNELRKSIIKLPKVKILPTQKFYDFLASKNKIGGQNKFPRVLNHMQRIEWERFLTSAAWI